MFDRFVLMCVRVHLRLLRRSCVLLIKLVFGSFLVPVRVPSPSAQVELEVLFFFCSKKGDEERDREGEEKVGNVKDR